MREQIAKDRFIWKKQNWLKPENIKAIWIASKDGKLTFFYEFNTPIQIPNEPGKKDRLIIKDIAVIDSIEKHMLEFNVSGARGRGIIIGELMVPFDNQKIKLIIMSTLKDWRDWQENKRNYKIPK